MSRGRRTHLERRSASAPARDAMSLPRRVLALLLLAPPGFLALAGLAMLAAAPGAWGAAAHAEIPNWMPVAAGVGFGLPALLVGGMCMRALRGRLRLDYTIEPLQLIFGPPLMTAIALVLIGLALRLGDASTYDSLLDEQGEPNTSPSGFLFISLFGAFFTACLVGGAAYVYALAVTPGASKRFERQPYERDAIADMMRGRRG